MKVLLYKRFKMGECKTITTKELLNGNLRYCLSALRVFNKCYECPEYCKKDTKGNIKICESRIINKEWDLKQEKIKGLNEQINTLKEQLKGV